MSTGPISSLHPLDQRDHRGLVGHVQLDAEATDLGAHGLRGVTVAVDDDDGASAVGHPSTSDRGADATAAAGDDGHPVVDFHRVPPCPEGPVGRLGTLVGGCDGGGPTRDGHSLWRPPPAASA